MVSQHFKIKNLNVEFVFRHRFEKRDTKYEFVWADPIWRVHFFSKKMFSKKLNEVAASKIIGFEFFFFKTWIKFERWK